MQDVTGKDRVEVHCDGGGRREAEPSKAKSFLEVGRGFLEWKQSNLGKEGVRKPLLLSWGLCSGAMVESVKSDTQDSDPDGALANAKAWETPSTSTCL